MYHNFHIQCNRQQLPDQQSVMERLGRSRRTDFSNGSDDQHDADIKLEGSRSPGEN